MGVTDIKGNKSELLCPSGDLERLHAAVDFGADAVYLAGEEFGMRTAATNFGEDDLKKGIEYAHSHGVKVLSPAIHCRTMRKCRVCPIFVDA